MTKKPAGPTTCQLEPVIIPAQDSAEPPRRRGRPKGSGVGPKGNVFSIRGSEEWRAWVGRLADHDRLKVADVIDKALVAYAKEQGFDEPAPRR